MSASPPPIENHLIQLLAQHLHVGIGKASVHRAHAVGVIARAVNVAAELRSRHFTWGIVAAIIAARDAEGEAHVAGLEVGLWLSEATFPFHIASGEFHTRLFDHVNGCGMGA